MKRLTVILLGSVLLISCSREPRLTSDDSSRTPVKEIGLEPTATPRQPKRSRENGPPLAGLYGRFKGQLKREGVEIVEPDLKEYLTSEGIWNGKEVEILFRHEGKTYKTTDEIPGLSEELKGRAGTNGLSISIATWSTYLRNRQASKTPSEPHKQ